MSAAPAGERFGAIPVRAFRDTRLSAGDFRLLGAIAYHDRLGRNGAGCYVDPRRLAEEAALSYSHVARHTRRLAGFGYLDILRSLKDRRKRIYRLIYNDNTEVVTDSGDNPADARANGASDAPIDAAAPEKVATVGDNRPEKVANAGSQVIDPPTKSAPLIDPVKQREKMERSSLVSPSENDACNTSRAAGSQKTRNARHAERGPKSVPRQRELRVFGDVTQQLFKPLSKAECNREEAAGRIAKAMAELELLELLPDAIKGGWEDCFERAIKAERRTRGARGAGIRYLVGCAAKAGADWAQGVLDGFHQAGRNVA